MKKVLFLFLLCISMNIKPSSTLSSTVVSTFFAPTETLTATPIAHEKPVLCYSKVSDIDSPRQRTGQYVRTAAVKPEYIKGKTTSLNTSTPLPQYYFGEYISTQKKTSMVIEIESGAPKIPGVDASIVGYFKNPEGKIIILYPYDPLKTNIDAAGKEVLKGIFTWITSSNKEAEQESKQ